MLTRPRRLIYVLTRVVVKRLTGTGRRRVHDRSRELLNDRVSETDPHSRCLDRHHRHCLNKELKVVIAHCHLRKSMRRISRSSAVRAEVFITSQ